MLIRKALLAVIISTDFLNQDSNLVVGAITIWVVLLIGFLKTKDS
jgi:hypothetical protein